MADDMSKPMIYRRLNEMDYDVHSGQYRMLENFTPEVRFVEATLRVLVTHIRITS